MGGASERELAEAVKELFPHAEAVALRRGSRGAVLVTDNEFWVARPSPATRVIDPTGVGNAFSGALAVAWLRHQQNPRLALADAMSAAEITIAHSGPALPITERTRQAFEAASSRQSATITAEKDFSTGI